jgi:CubicO group peptidase (beta-lactamase class C family)
VSAPAGPRFAEPPIEAPSFLDPDRRAKFVGALPKLDAHFAELMAKSKIPGLAVGLVVDGDLVWSKGYGVRSLDGKQPVDADTVFRLSSDTKSFTGVAVLQQRDAGKLSLDAPAEALVPELAGVVYPTRDAPRITLRHLLTHRAGLPHDGPAYTGQATSPSLDDAVKSVVGLVLDAPPGEAYAYSNLGYQLAGRAVERAAGQPFRAYLTEHVLRPLGMTSTSFEPDPARLALGYRLEDGALKHPPLYLAQELDPQGGLWSTVRDMARYASFQLAAWPPRDDADDGPLRRSSVREAQAMSTWTGLEVFPRDVGKPQRANATGYGYGWETQETCEWDRAVFHPGGRPDGYYSMVFLLPESGVGIVLLINFMDTEGVAGQAVRDAARILGAAGALEKRELRPSKAQLAVRDAVLSLYTHWDRRLAERTFGPADYFFKLEAVFAIKHRLHGACQMGTPTAVDRLNLRWTAKCERGKETFSMTLGSDGAHPVAIWVPSTLPPDERLAAAAPKLAALVGRWDDKAFDAIMAPAIARAPIKAVFAEAGTTLGRCRTGAPDEDGDETHARFPLTCDRGPPVVLRATLDDTSGKVTEVTLGAPPGAGGKCP